jgi:hypothetical protein
MPAPKVCIAGAPVPSRAQMIGIGYSRAISVTTSQRPVPVWRSTSSVMTSTTVVRSRAVAHPDPLDVAAATLTAMPGSKEPCLPAMPPVAAPLSPAADP